MGVMEAVAVPAVIGRRDTGVSLRRPVMFLNPCCHIASHFAVRLSRTSTVFWRCSIYFSLFL